MSKEYKSVLYGNDNKGYHITMNAATAIKALYSAGTPRP